jgi:hypothetical protein
MPPLLTFGAVALAQLDGAVIPLAHPSIAYGSKAATDVVAKLQRGIEDGTMELRFDDRPGIGYLPALLDALQIPVASQVVAFSETSLQAPLIGPKHPRTIFFNDDAAVAFVRGGLIEIAAHDPRQGAVFYTLRQLPDAARLERQNGCLGCHYSHATLGVPGFLVRSIPTASDGQTLPWLGNVVPNHSTPVEERWGGWYVTGAVSSQEHSGNLFIENSRASEMPPERPAALQDLRSQLNTDGYLSPYSDVVAHLLFEHQLRMMNILTRIGWEARLVSSDSGSESTLHESIEEASVPDSGSVRRRSSRAAICLWMQPGSGFRLLGRPFAVLC